MNKMHRLLGHRLIAAWAALVARVQLGAARAAAVVAAMAVPGSAALAEPAPTALPTGGQLAAGQATISQQGATLTIDQASNRAAIDWRSFDVGSQAQVRFIQPSTGAVTLNRVDDPHASQIFGKITANGQVFLSNPSGVYFAPGASVDVGGLVATTHTISLDDFMAGRVKFDRQGATGSVVNDGELKAVLGGYIALLAPEVRNQGVILASLGTVALAAGERFELKFDANNTLASLRVEPSTIRALVDNRSAVLAPGGLILLSAQAVDRVQGGVVRNSGRLEATGVAQRGGRILLDASGQVDNSGRVSADATAQGPAGSVGLTAPEVVNSGSIVARGSVESPTGGSVAVAAGRFTQDSGGVLAVSAPGQGGSVRVQASGQVVLAGRIDASAALPVTETATGTANVNANANANATGTGTGTGNAPAPAADAVVAAPVAAGGTVVVKAAQLSLRAAVVDASGDQGGSVVLDASGAAPDTPLAPQPAPLPGQTVLMGATQVSSRGRRGSGGTLTVLGDAIALNDQTLLDARGSTAGGTVRVGGGWQGSGDDHQATRVAMAAGSRIDVSATERGDGGTAVLWSDVGNPDSLTAAHGVIAATGGAAGGNGGRVETSGHRLESAGARVDASAPHGRSGQWLLDPYNITIASSGASGTAYGSNYTSGADSVVLNTDIQNSLNNGTSVTLTTGSGGASAGDIFVNAAIAKTAGGDATLTLRADRDIRVNAGNNITSTAGKLNLVLWADFDSVTGGTIWLGDVNNTVQTTVNTNGGHFWAGGSGYTSPGGNTVWNGLTVGDGYANSPIGGGTASWYGVQLNKTALVTGGGSVQLKGLGASTNGTQPQMGVYLGAGSSLSTGAGNLDIVGRTQGQTTDTPSVNYGVDIDNSTLASTSGAVTISGYSAGKASQAAGVQILDASVATTTGSLAITGTTDSTAPATAKHGILLFADAAGRTASVATTSGALLLDGTTSVSGSATADTSGVQLGTANSANTDTNNPVVKVVSQTGNVTIRGANPNNTSTASTNLAVRFNGSGYGKVYVGADGVAAYSGNTDIQGNSIGEGGFAGGYLSVQGSGTLTLEPQGSSFVTPFSLTGSYNLGAAHTGLTLGSATSTGDVTVSAAQTVAGPMAIYGGNIVLNGNLTMTAAGAGLFVKASGSVTVGANGGANFVDQTNGGAITFWGDSDASGDGRILLSENTRLDSRTAADRSAGRTTTASGGGDITLGGGNGASAASGYAASDGTNSAQGGVNLGDQTYNNNAHTNLTTIDSGGGNILIRGKSSSGMQGINWVNGGELNAGSTGSVTLTGLNTSTGLGVELASWHGTGTATVIGGGNLQLTGSATGSSGGNGMQSGAASLQAVGAGSLAITGSTANTSNKGITGPYDALAASGAISLNGGTQGIGISGGSFGKKAGSNVTASAASVTFSGDAIAFTGASTVDTTGALAIEPAGNNFAATLQYPLGNLTVAASVTGLRLGKDIGSANHSDTITVGSAQTIAGPISVYAGNVNLNANLTSTAAGAGLLAKASNNITTATSTVLQTNGGAITFWSDSDASSAGYLLLNNYLTLDSRTASDRTAGNTTTASGGGAITLGGGASLATGYAVSANVTDYGGINFGDHTVDSNNNTTLYSGGGAVAMRGKATGASMGIQWVKGGLINAGSTGTISLNGLNTGSGHGIELGAWTGSGTTTMLAGGGSAGAPAISLTGAGGSSGNGVQGSPTSLQATGAGGVSVTGSAPASNNGLSFGALDALSASGPVNLSGGTSGIRYAGTLGAKTGTAVTSSSSAVTLTGDSLLLAAASTVTTTGTLTVQSTSASFASAFSWGSTLTVAPTVSGFTLGTTTNTADVTLASAVNVAGPISVYGGNVIDNAALTSTLANAGVLLKATAKVTANANLTTSGGDITLWANSAGATTGGIEVKNGKTLASGGGWITLGGSAGGTLIAGLPATSTNGTTLPQGYAQNATASAGVSLGSDPGTTSTDANIAINSGNGRIGLAGQSSTYAYDGSNYYYSFGLAAYNGANLNAGTGDIAAYGSATGAGGSNHYNWGVDIAPFASLSTLKTLWKTSGGNLGVNGSATGASNGNSGASLDGGASTGVTLENLGPSGGSVTVNGSASGSSGSATGVRLYTVNLLGAGGSLAINANGAGLPLNTIASNTVNLGAAASTDVTASTAAVTLTADALGTNGTLNVKTAGALTVQPFSTSFTNALTWPVTNYNLIGTLGGLTLGKAGNTADITLVSATSIAGPINVYGGDITLNANLSSTAASAAILLKASGSITQAAGVAVTTNGGSATYWADSDATGGGFIWLKSASGTGASISTSGGAITLSGGVDTSTGYAQGNTTVNGNGVTLDTATLNSAGGNVLMRGKSASAPTPITTSDGATSNTDGVRLNGSDSINAGSGTLSLYGVGLGSGASNGVELSQTGSSTLQSSNATAAAVRLDGSSLNASGTFGFGVFTWGNSSISATGGGGITLAGNGAKNAGVVVYTGANLLANSGRILLQGSGPSSGSFAAGVEIDGTVGQKAASAVTASTSAIDVIADAVYFSAGTAASSGALSITSSSAAFTAPVTLSGLSLSSGLTGLTIGKTTNTADLTLPNAITIAGPIGLYGGNLALNAGLTASGANTITLAGSGNVTAGASGFVSASNLALLGGNVTLTNASNAVATLAASGVSGLSFADSTALTVGTVGATSGITATGAVSVGTASGDLTVTQNIGTTATSSTALVLNAGVAAAAGTATGGNLVLTGSPTVTVGSGGTAKLYTGSTSGSTGLTALVGSGSGRFRYGSDESASNYTAALATGLNAIYRERPTVTRAIDNLAVTYGTAPVPTFSTSGNANGDTALQMFASTPTVTVGGSTSTSGNYTAGSHTLTGSGAGTSPLGYTVNSAITAGTLTVAAKALTVSYADTGKAYDGNLATTVTRSGDDRATNDAVTVAWTGAAFASKDAASNIAVQVSGVTLSGTDATNYTVASGSTTATITQRTITLAGSKTYDGTTSLTGAVTLGGLVGTETLAYTGATASSAHVAASGKYVSAITLVNGTNGGLASNYALPTLDASNAAVTLAAKAIGGSASIGGALSKSYDGTTAATGASVSGSVTGAVSGDLLGLVTSGLTLGYDSAHVGSASSIVASGAAGFTVTSTTHSSVASDYAFTAPTLSAATASISAATLTASLGNTGVTKTYDGTTSAPTGFTPTWTVTGFANGDTAATIASTGAAFDSKNVATATKVTVSGLSVTGITGSLGSLANDYALGASSRDLAASVSAKTVTLTAAKVYDGATSLAGAVTLGGLIGAETLSYTGATASDAHVATSGKFINAVTLANGTNGGLGSNYSLPTLNLANAAVSISARAIGASAGIGGTVSKVYDGTTTALGATVTGSVTGAVSGDLLGLVTSGVTLGYNSAHVGSASSIVASGTAGFAVTSTANGSLASDYAFTAPTISAAAAGISAASLTASLSNTGVTKTYDGTTAAPVGFTPAWALTGFAAGDTAATLASTGAAFDSRNVASASKVTVSGMSIASVTGSLGSASGDYALGASSRDVAASVTARTVTLAGSKTYDGSNSLAGNTLAIGGLIGAETLSALGATASDAHLATSGKYVNAITLADGTNSGLAGNYALPTLDVAHAPVTIAARAIGATAAIGGLLTKAYDGTTAATGASVGGSVTGAIAGDTLALATGGLTLAYDSAHVVAASRIAATGSASFAVSASSHGSQASDYSFTAPVIAAATASITPATLSASLGNTGVTKVYDGTLDAPTGFVPTWSITGLAAGDTSAAIVGTAATYDGASVATASKVTVSGMGLASVTGSQGSQTSDYLLPVTRQDVAAAITAKAITLSGSKTYDGATDLAGAISIGGLIGTETLAYTGATASDAHVATGGKFVTAISLGNGTNGGLVGNYALPTLDLAHAPVTIAARAITGAATIGGTLTKAYDGTPSASGASVGGSVSGAIAGDTLTLATGGVTLAYDSAHVAAASSIVATGTAGYTVAATGSGSQASDYRYTAPTIAAVAASVTPATLAASLGNAGVTKVYDGSTDAPAGFTPNWNVSGLVAGDAAAALTYTTASYDSKDVVGASKLGIAGLGIGGVTGNHGSQPSDYLLAATGRDVAASVTPKILTVSGPTAVGKTYDGTTGVDITAWGSVDPQVGSEALRLTATSAAFADANAGLAKTVVASGYGLADGGHGGLASNYRLSAGSATTTADIAKAVLTVVANDDARFVVQADTAGYGGVSYSGFVHGETGSTAGLTGSASVVRSNAGVQTAGSYDGVLAPDLTQLASTNYRFVTHTGRYTIVPANQLLLRVAPVDNGYGTAASYAVASAEYLDGQRQVVVSLSGIAALGHNRYSVSDGQGGSAAFTLTPTGATTSSSGWTAVGVYPLGAVDVATQNAQNFSNTLTVVGHQGVTPQAVTAVADQGVSKVYDGGTAMLGVTLQLAGVLGGDGVTVDGNGTFASRNAGRNIGYTLSGVRLAGADAQDYYLAGNGSFSGSNGTIRPRPLTVTFTGVDKVYDGSAAATVRTVDNRIAGDLLTVGASASFADKNVGAGKPVTVGGVTLGGVDAGNYTVAPSGSARASITTLSSVTWIGGAGGNWFDPANWAGGAVPDLSNVANVVIPAGARVTFDTAAAVAPTQAGPVHLDSLGSAGSLTQDDGQLVIGAGGVTLGAYTQQGGSLSSAGSIDLVQFTQTQGQTTTAGNFTVHGSFAQGPGGTLAVAGDASLSATQGKLTLGNLQAGGALNLLSTGGDIVQSNGTVLTVRGTTTADAGSNDIRLDAAGNDFVGPVNASGHDITLADGQGGLVLGNLTTAGSLAVTSTGGDLTQAAASTLKVQGTTLIDAAGHDVVLANPTNDFVGAVGARGHDVTLVDGRGGVTLGSIVASGALSVTSTGGDLVQAAGSRLQVTGPSNLTAPGARVVLAPGPSVAPVVPDGSGAAAGAAAATADTAQPLVVLAPARPAVELPTPETAPPGMGNLSAGLSTRMPGDAAASPAYSALQVRLVSEPTGLVPGQMSVEVPRDAVQRGFAFTLPTALDDPRAPDELPVVTKVDGKPLPAWLTYDAGRRQVVAQAVPPRGLPLKISVTVGGRRTVIVISRAARAEARARPASDGATQAAVAKPRGRTRTTTAALAVAPVAGPPA